MEERKNQDIPGSGSEEDRRSERERAVARLHEKMAQHRDGSGRDEVEEALWQAVIAYQGYPFYTVSGLAFSYTVKKNTRTGEYGGEILVSRKEGSKTLTKSSVMLAFHKVLEQRECSDGSHLSRTLPDGVNGESAIWQPPEYKGPKAIGQIFGISYIYSLFWKLGLIRVPEKVEAKLVTAYAQA